MKELVCRRDRKASNARLSSANEPSSHSLIVHRSPRTKYSPFLCFLVRFMLKTTLLEIVGDEPRSFG